MLYQFRKYYRFKNPKCLGVNKILLMYDYEIQEIVHNKLRVSIHHVTGVRSFGQILYIFSHRDRHECDCDSRKFRLFDNPGILRQFKCML